MVLNAAGLAELKQGDVLEAGVLFRNLSDEKIVWVVNNAVKVTQQSGKSKEESTSVAVNVKGYYAGAHICNATLLPEGEGVKFRIHE